MKALLISTENVKKLAFIQGNVEDSILRTVIYRVQDRMIQPILGCALYDRLQQAVIDNDFTAAEQKLLVDYIYDAIAAGSDFKAVIHTTDQIRNKATGKTGDENLQANSEKDNSLVRDELRRDFEYYRQRIIKFLGDNWADYPEYFQEGEPGACHCERRDTGKPYKKIYFR